MLTDLRITNFALVEELAVEFRPGLNIITGETGAGKSILIGALSLLLGERANKAVIRTDTDRSSVEAVFALTDTSQIDSILDETGIEPCDNGELILRRIVSASGSGRVFINGSASTVQVLKQIGDLLVDMHGPHDHQSLLSPDFQMAILDSFGALDNLRTDYQDQYAALTGFKNDLQKLDQDDDSVADQIDLLKFQVKEIEDAKLEEGEEEDIKSRHARSANAQQILESAQTVCSLLSEGDMTVIDSLAAAQRELERMQKHLPEAAEWIEEAQSASVQLQELSKAISSSVHDIENDPKELEWLDDRLTVYQKMKRKYGSTVLEIQERLEKATARLHELETRGERVAELESEISAADKKVRTLGAKLGKARRKAAAELADSITEQLQDLGFANGSFHVELADAEPGPSGTDTIEFGFAPNVGEAMRPLRMIASSGEISRVMLATKAVLALHDRIPLLVFDEIDTNVGGEMGFAIGSKLAGIADSHQVICITHLPQVAAYGSTHFGVAKGVRDERTFTAISELDHEGRTGEIARMLGGSDPSDVTLEHARELLQKKK